MVGFESSMRARCGGGGGGVPWGVEATEVEPLVAKDPTADGWYIEVVAVRDDEPLRAKVGGLEEEAIARKGMKLRQRTQRVAVEEGLSGG